MNPFKAILNAITSFNSLVPDVSLLREVSIGEAHFLFVLIGLAFGPDGARHWSRLTTSEQSELLARVPVLQTNHTDWPKPLRWVPRTTTTWLLDNGRPPVVAGNTDDPKPIPDNGKWFVTRGYFAWTGFSGIHVRMGFRFDDVDGYLTFPSFTIKKRN